MGPWWEQEARFYQLGDTKVDNCTVSENLITMHHPRKPAYVLRMYIYSSVHWYTMNTINKIFFLLIKHDYIYVITNTYSISEKKTIGSYRKFLFVEQNLLE